MTNSSVDSRYLELFPQWLRGLGEDATALGETLASLASEDDGARSLVAGLNYVFKSLDLIPDGVEDLGLLDDAFVLRVACALATATHPELKQGVVGRLAQDARAVRDFLDADYPRLESYVQNLQKGAARGRTVEDIVTDRASRDAFLADVRAWAAAYQAPSFTRDAKTLVKLKAFLGKKLA
jgi:hypothetical protein